MSDIGLNWGPFDYAFIALFLGGPGLVVGAAIGAIVGLALWIGGLLYINDVI